MASYEQCYTFKCVASACCTLYLALWSVLQMEHASIELAPSFMAYFV